MAARSPCKSARVEWEWEQTRADLWATGPSKSAAILSAWVNYFLHPNCP